MAAKDKPKRKKVDSVPIIGVRGSGTMISAPKAVVLGGAGLLVATPPPGAANSPLDDLMETGLADGIERLRFAAERSLGKGGVGRKALVALGGMALFGKAIDRRFPGFPIKFGK